MCRKGENQRLAVGSFDGIYLLNPGRREGTDADDWMLWGNVEKQGLGSLFMVVESHWCNVAGFGM